MKRLRLANEYGGKGPMTFPPDHVPAIPVPKGGSCCENCMFVDAARHECKSPHYIEWNGSPKLPDLPLDEICSDWYDWAGSSQAGRLHSNPVRPVAQHHFVWTVNKRGEVVGQMIDGPYTEKEARVRASLFAIRSDLDRAVSFGYSPSARDFKILDTYEARTGKKL